MVAFVAGPLTSAALNTAFNAATLNTQSGSTYTLALTDHGGIVDLTATSGTATVTVPPNSSVPFATGDMVGIMASGTAVCVVAPGSGVTLESYGTARTLVGQGAIAVLIKRASDTWTLAGGIRV